jgi:hypothetical protein
MSNSSLIGYDPIGMVVDRNNTIFVVSAVPSSLLVLPINGNSTVLSIDGPLAIARNPYGDLYLAFNNTINRVTTLFTPGTVVMRVNVSCVDLFIDCLDNIYCSQTWAHQVQRKLFDDPPNQTTIIAGDGINGSTSTRLSSPRGLAMDLNFTLFVADMGNHRIQRFLRNQSAGTTVAGIGAPGTVILLSPTGVILDADGHLFIADNGNRRIVGQGSYGFRCIVGCAQSSGSAAHELSDIRGLSFEQHDGHLWVLDGGNRRIQRFLSTKSSCSK